MGENSRGHAINDCPHYENLRNKASEKIRQVWRSDFRENDLEDTLNKMYFAPSVSKENRKKEMEIIKQIVAELYKTQKKKDMNAEPALIEHFPE